MFNSAVQLTFPCPACGSFLTLRSFRAAGPCPNCATFLDVNLGVTQGEPPAAVPTLEGQGRRFADRRFRPVVRTQPAPPASAPPPAAPPAPMPQP
ncbi:MAG: hypothetical protein HKN82_03555, partial [Akkermansiaceae bacterium]|nr:hypothetical protein [Akkermansiaceae bacterium]